MIVMHVLLLFPTPQNFTDHFYRTIDYWLEYIKKDMKNNNSFLKEWKQMKIEIKFALQKGQTNICSQSGGWRTIAWPQRVCFNINLFLRTLQLRAGKKSFQQEVHVNKDVEVTDLFPISKARDSHCKLQTATTHQKSLLTLLLSGVCLFK